MSLVKVKWVGKSYLLCKQQSKVGQQRIPVIELSALADVVEGLQRIVGQAHGGAMLGGDDAYESCLAIEVLAQRLLAQVGEVGK